MNTESVNTRKLAPGEKLNEVGDFVFSDECDCLYIILPGTKAPDAIAIQRGAPGGARVWGWDGNEDLPTLTPSIHAPGQWHGYLTAGRLVSC